MRTYEVTVREGELLGPIDWDYNYAQDFDSCPAYNRARSMQRSLAILRLLEAEPSKYEATTYGGWPRCCWGEILAIGMYDGWPYWRPVPSVMLSSLIGGGEWHSFCSITDIRVKGEHWPLEINTGRLSTDANHDQVPHLPS